MMMYPATIANHHQAPLRMSLVCHSSGCATEVRVARVDVGGGAHALVVKGGGGLGRCCGWLGGWNIDVISPY